MNVVLPLDYGLILLKRKLNKNQLCWWDPSAGCTQITAIPLFLLWKFIPGEIYNNLMHTCIKFEDNRLSTFTLSHLQCKRATDGRTNRRTNTQEMSIPFGYIVKSPIGNITLFLAQIVTRRVITLVGLFTRYFTLLTLAYMYVSTHRRRSDLSDRICRIGSVWSYQTLHNLSSLSTYRHGRD